MAVSKDPTPDPKSMILSDVEEFRDGGKIFHYSTSEDSSEKNHTFEFVEEFGDWLNSKIPRSQPQKVETNLEQSADAVETAPVTETKAESAPVVVEKPIESEVEEESKEPEVIASQEDVQEVERRYRPVQFAPILFLAVSVLQLTRVLGATGVIPAFRAFAFKGKVNPLSLFLQTLPVLGSIALALISQRVVLGMAGLFQFSKEGLTPLSAFNDEVSFFSKSFARQSTPIILLFFLLPFVLLR